jgi:hypothetical protein
MKKMGLNLADRFLALEEDSQQRIQMTCNCVGCLAVPVVFVVTGWLIWLLLNYLGR